MDVCVVAIVDKGLSGPTVSTLRNVIRSPFQMVKHTGGSEFTSFLNSFGYSPIILSNNQTRTQCTATDATQTVGFTSRPEPSETSKPEITAYLI